MTIDIWTNVTDEQLTTAVYTIKEELRRRKAIEWARNATFDQILKLLNRTNHGNEGGAINRARFEACKAIGRIEQGFTKTECGIPLVFTPCVPVPGWKAAESAPVSEPEIETAVRDARQG